MTGARILLVEDDEALRGLLARNLQERGPEVRSARDGDTALAYLRASPIDLVLLDINLPDQTGWEVLRNAQRYGLLRSQALGHATPCFPVVVLSAVRVSPRRLAEFHPLAYLPKPFPMEAVLRLASEAAKRRNGDVVPEQEDEEGSPGALLDEDELHA